MVATARLLQGVKADKQIIDGCINARRDVGIVFVEPALANESFGQPIVMRHPQLDEISEVGSAQPLRVGGFLPFADLLPVIAFRSNWSFCSGV
jgi:hypothetical protein